jgi:hypothetical protein
MLEHGMTKHLVPKHHDKHRNKDNQTPEYTQNSERKI